MRTNIDIDDKLMNDALKATGLKWIDYFCGHETSEVDILDKSLGVRVVAVGDLVLTEVLQGLRTDKDYRPTAVAC